jgi:predicted amino acid racemase
VAEALDPLDGGRFAGITTFPALLYHPQTQQAQPTPNLSTLARAAGRLGRTRVNAPGTTSTVVLSILAEHGATQVEPGHALTGTTPLHAIRDLPELPAVLYLTEVSHHHAGRAYCFGGGMYIDPVFPPYRVLEHLVRVADQVSSPEPRAEPNHDGSLGIGAASDLANAAGRHLASQARAPQRSIAR